MATVATTLTSWIDLRDRQTGAQLWTGRNEATGGSRLFLFKLSNKSPKWRQAISTLGFKETTSGRFLYLDVPPKTKIRVETFRAVFPSAVIAQMPMDKFHIDTSPKASARPSGDADSDELRRSVSTELAGAKRLGRNADGDEVYLGGGGRFIYRPQQEGRQAALLDESALKDSLRPHLFLRAPDAASLDLCADGMVRSMLSGEVQRADDLRRFIFAVTGRPEAQQTEQDVDSAHEVIDAAVIRQVRGAHATANDAYGDSTRLYENAPPYTGKRRGNGAMPGPLSVIAQRLLGDTANKSVVYPNAFDGAAFAFLPEGTKIRAYRGSRDLSERASGLTREGLEWHAEFNPAREAGVDAIFFNADPTLDEGGQRRDYRDALISLRTLASGGRAVLVLAGDDPMHPGTVAPASHNFMRSVLANYQVEDVFECSKALTQGVGTGATLRVLALRNVKPTTDQQGEYAAGIPVVHSWDEVKARVDQAIAKAKVVEAQSADGIDVDNLQKEVQLQRPYIAFSKASESSTMVPQELQAPLQGFMSDLEGMVGPVDEFVKSELGLAGDESLKTWSAEQVDSMAMAMFRIKRGRGHINGADTGTGKGRMIAGMVTWALKQGRPVIFITDRANLFSDLARDLRDVGERGRVRPLIMNSDGKIVDSIGDAGTLAEGTPPAVMAQIMAEGKSIGDAQANVVFATYSQISNDGSEKALWIKNNLANAFLVVDEAHVAAGSDSNISAQIVEMTSLAWGVQYASATWAKTPENLHIFGRAFPESVNVATLSQTMRRGGASFAEVFCSMLAREGAFIRFEHDSSKLEFTIEVDEENARRNNAVADSVAVIMSAIAFAAGDLRKLVSRASEINLTAVRSAREARAAAQGTKVFASRFGTGSMLYQVMRRVNAALNVANTVRLAREGLEAGRKPVIVFDDTGEAFIRAAMERQAEIGPNGRPVLPESIKPPTLRDLMHKVLDSLVSVRVRDLSAEEAIALAQDPDLEQEEADADAAAEVDAMVAEVPFVDGVAPPAARAGGGDDGIDVDAVVREVEAANVAGAATGEAGEAGVATAGGAAASRRVAPPRRYRNVKFWDVENISAEQQDIFRKGVAEIEKLIEALPEISIMVPDEIAAGLSAAGYRVGEISGRSFSLTPASVSGVPSIDRESTLGTQGLGVRRQREEMAFAPVTLPPEVEPTLPGWRIGARKKSKAIVNSTVRSFNNGDLDGLVINRSAATGLSLHASPRFIDRRRRQMTVAQAPENPTDLAQLMGRVNRKDQDSFPWIQMASTGIEGELRQLMMQNKKQAAMSANVRSDRRALININSVPDLLNPVGQQVCRAYLEDNPEVLSLLDMTPKDIEVDSGVDVASRLTSRIPLLRTAHQKAVYEELFLMFTDAIVQAELRGENPLKPNEMAVRAEFSKPKVLFGLDHKGLGSAFDGAVFAQRVDWVERFQPLSLDQVLGMVEGNRMEMVRKGQAQLVEGSTADAPVISIDELVRKVEMRMMIRARAALAGSSFATLEAALASTTPNPVRATGVRAKWLKENLGKLVPGACVLIAQTGVQSWRGANTYVVVGLQVPAPGKEAQLTQWRVSLYRPGAPRPVIMSVSQLMGSVKAFVPTPAERDAAALGVAEAAAPARRPLPHRPAPEAVSGRTAPALATSPLDVLGEVVGDADIDDDICVAAREARDVGQRGRRGMAARLVDGLQYRWASERHNRAIVLTGNMYLASEWASSTKAGEGVIISDDKGVRHRAIMLNDKFKPEFFAHLPRRLWMPEMLRDFAQRLHEEFPDQPCRMFTDFSTAWSDVVSSAGRVGMRKGHIVITPGAGIVVSYGKEQLRRINAMLRSAQKAIKEHRFGVAVPAQDDPDHVVISTPKAARGRAAQADDSSAKTGAGAIVLKAETPEKMARAIEMFVRGPGLELFVTVTDAGGRLKQLAAQCARDYFERRLRSEAEGDPARMAKVDALLAGGFESDDDNAMILAELQQLQQTLYAERGGDDPYDEEGHERTPVAAEGADGEHEVPPQRMRA
jgi:hypothetical protein